MKQTAVEFLVQKINKLTGLSIAMDEPCVEEAKEMEKQQIKNAWDNGFDEIDRASRTSQNYYNETYKNKEQ